MGRKSNSPDADLPVIEAVGLSRSVWDGKRIKTTLAGFSFSFMEGRIYTIVGPSGAGKSSLLRLLNRLDEPTEGKIRFVGKSTTGYNPCQLRRLIGYLFQTSYLFPGTMLDNLLYADSKLSLDTISRMAELVHLPKELADRDVETLSVGEKQRVALARLLTTNPKVILLDEPTSALDPSHTESIEQLIKEIVVRSTMTAIMVTHDPEQALRMGSETILMVDGQMAEYGPSEKVINAPQTEAGRLYKAKRLQ